MSHSSAFERFNERIDKRARREFFKARWAEFLRSRYRSPEHVAVAFDVTFQSAWNWWNGLVCPLGDEVSNAYQLHPEAAAFFGEARAA